VRADARRNRERLLAAADLVFTEGGPGASTEEVARRAGVGVGTVFRHFPTKESLLEAVFVAWLSQLAEATDKLSRAEDPGPAFFAFVDTVIEQSARKKVFSEALADAGVDIVAATAPAKSTLRQAGDTLLDRAQRAGVIRPDIDGEELMAVIVGLSRTAAHLGHDPALRDRAIAILVDGLRAR